MSLPKIDKTSVSVSLVVSVITVALPAWLFIDNRFAHASDVNGIKQAQLADIKDIKQMQLAQFKELKENPEQTSRVLRKQMVSDKVFELELKHINNAVDRALLERYKRELETLK